MDKTEQVCIIIERATGQKVDGMTALQSLEVDSLEFLDLLLMIGQECGKEIPDDKVPHLITVSEIAKAIS